MKKSPLLFPKMARRLSAFGERLKLARKRRKISMVRMAERVGVSRATLYKMEKGDPSVAMGHYAAALRVLGLETDVDALAGDDELGHRLQDAELLSRRRSEGGG